MDLIENSTNINHLKKSWKSLTSKYSNDIYLTENIYSEIILKYNEKTRHYHTVEHLEHMFSLTTDFINKISDIDTFLYSIWFHDVIYKPLKSDNEEQSAVFAEKSLKIISVQKPMIEKIKDMILKTKNHTIVSDSECFDIRLFIDIDLAILGAGREKYSEYAQKIRKEYYFVPEMIYNHNRALLLKNFLSSNKIYKTIDFQNFYEQSARENLMWEIDLLKK